MQRSAAGNRGAVSASSPVEGGGAQLLTCRVFNTDPGRCDHRGRRVCAPALFFLKLLCLIHVLETEEREKTTPSTVPEAMKRFTTASDIAFYLIYYII